jgi:hypothetical protein
MAEQTAKTRHGCLTAWLILMIVLNSATALFYLLGTETMQQAFPTAPRALFFLLALLGVFNLVCAIALFRWKKWGFWAFCGSSVLALLVNLSLGLGIRSTVLGLLGFIILYGVLHIGKENKGWPQLE